MNIAIIEDDIDMANLIAKKLTNNWYEVSIFNSEKEFKSNYNKDIDLYIIDIFLWDGDWFEIIKWLREVKKLNTPIIITSAYNDTERKIYWLDIWADDYLSKPFVPNELLARIRTLLRRSSENINSSIIKHYNIEFYLNTKEVKLLWKIIHFTKKELLTIELFLLNKWKLITKTKLINSVWWNIDLLWITDNNINVILSKIRKKLWNNFKLKTIFNWWYILK